MSLLSFVCCDKNRCVHCKGGLLEYWVGEDSVDPNQKEGSVRLGSYKCQRFRDVLLVRIERESLNVAKPAETFGVHW